MSTYLFYDLETTGLNRAFDQVLQFAAIRTDMSFNEIDRHEIRIKLRPDVIISPYAIITHRIPIRSNQSNSQLT
jgi:exodeoxyribonuclease I